MEIVLARHGMSKLDQRDWMAPRRLADWLVAYNKAEVFPGEVPRLTSMRASRSATIVSSPLP